MTWVKWYTLEITTGIGILVNALPLSLPRWFLTVALVTLFAIFYHQRLQAQQAAKIADKD